MSKIGKLAIPINQGVNVLVEGSKVTVKGQGVELSYIMPRELRIKKESESITIERSSESKKIKSVHGLYRQLLANAVAGVVNPWETRLEIVGTGYNVKLQGEDLLLKVGYSHNVKFEKVRGIKFRVEGNNKIVVSGADKQLVGQVAYRLRIIKKPDAYKGKGIRYLGEVIKLKPGKKVKTVTAAAK